MARFQVSTGGDRNQERDLVERERDLVEGERERNLEDGEESYHKDPGKNNNNLRLAWVGSRFLFLQKVKVWFFNFQKFYK